MGKRKMRRETQEAARDQMAWYDEAKKRCGSGNWARAWQELIDETDIKFSEFANPKFDCRECPLYLECLSRNHFSNNTKWRFSWYEEENRETQRKDPDDHRDPPEAA